MNEPRLIEDEPKVASSMQQWLMENVLSWTDARLPFKII
jgi:hypothetical protein